VEVSALVNATTQKLKGEIERLKAMLEPAASSLAQAVSEKDKALSDREQLVAEIQTMRKTIDDEGTTFGGRMKSLESAMHKSTAMASSILQSVEAFQKHVLPNFRVVPTQINKSQKTSDSDGSEKIVDEVHIYAKAQL
jgi:maltooligosyltrehalose synthase